MLSDRVYVCIVCGLPDNRRRDSLRAPMHCGHRMRERGQATADGGSRARVEIQFPEESEVKT